MFFVLYSGSLLLSWPDSGLVSEALTSVHQAQPSLHFASAPSTALTYTQRPRLSHQSCGSCYVLGCWFCVIGAMRPLSGSKPVNEREGFKFIEALFWGGCDGRCKGLGCRRGLNSYQFVMMSTGPGVGCHVHPHSHDRERKITDSSFGSSWPLMYFSEGQVLACQLCFKKMMLLALVC